MHLMIDSNRVRIHNKPRGSDQNSISMRSSNKSTIKGKVILWTATRPPRFGGKNILTPSPLTGRSKHNFKFSSRP